MMKSEEILRALKDAGVTVVGGATIEQQLVQNLEILSDAAGITTGHELIELLQNRNVSSTPYCFYVAPHESEENKMVVFSLDYPDVTMVIANSQQELARVAQDIIFQAHEKLMAAGAIIRPPLQDIQQEFPKGAGFVRVPLGDLYSLRLHQHNVRMACERFHIEATLDLNPDEMIYVH